jgi:porphobilinogen synthase
MPYLDVIHRLRQNSNLPIAAYQVSGEYAMIKAAASKVWIEIQHPKFEAYVSKKNVCVRECLTRRKR